MEKQVQKESKLIWILKSLLAAYLVTGILLVLLTFLLYQFELDEQYSYDISDVCRRGDVWRNDFLSNS